MAAEGCIGDVTESCIQKGLEKYSIQRKRIKITVKPAFHFSQGNRERV
jgi:hypothetical protein